MKKINLDYKKLYDLYINNKKSCIDIGRIFGCSQGTVSQNLKRYGIKSRPFSREGYKPWNKGKYYPLPHLKKYQFKKGHKLNIGKLA